MADLCYPMVISAAGEDEGGGFVAFAPDLEGCMADGATPEAALADLQAAIVARQSG
jgi:predicted RNase H-like HicB family nuclease